MLIKQTGPEKHAESLSACVSCVAAEKNLGYEYIQGMNRLVGISTGRIFSGLVIKRNLKHKQMKEIENSKTFKKNRLQ